MSIMSDIFNFKIAVTGLGYVGMPLAVEFAKKFEVIGFDINSHKIEQYKNGIDPTHEVGNDAVKNSTVHFTNNPSDLREANFHIIAVPTPVNQDKTPDLDPVIGASEIVGRNLTPGAIVVYESTVYPGVTEDICVPVLEKASGLKCGVGFKIGYSPERINPGDKVHRLTNIKKIVSGMDLETLNAIDSIYSQIIEAGVHRAPSIKVAEAAKVVENSQRDINIAFMNELAMVFDKMHIDTKDVIEAMRTKWNALPFTPGLVGGHCIGVDPYYFVYEAEKLGYHSQIILSGRKVNDSMGNFIAQAAIKELIQTGIAVKGAKVLIMGITFKENCPDSRNTKVVDIVNALKEYGLSPVVADPLADPVITENEYGIKLQPLEKQKDVDCIILAVAHNEYKAISFSEFEKFFRNGPNNQKVVIDVKSVLDKEAFTNAGYRFWRL